MGNFPLWVGHGNFAFHDVQMNIRICPGFPSDVWPFTGLGFVSTWSTVPRGCTHGCALQHAQW